MTKMTTKQQFENQITEHKLNFMYINTVYLDLLLIDIYNTTKTQYEKRINFIF